VSHIKARPTIYKGIQMRSRLEAKFAEWMESNGRTFNNENRPSMPGEFAYESECYADETGQYLPDFVLMGGGDYGATIYYEVKPSNADFDAALKRMHIIRSTHPDAMLCVVTQQGFQAGFTNKGRCVTKPNKHGHQRCHHCAPRSPRIEWTQEQADGMFDMIIELKRQRQMLRRNVVQLNKWADWWASETRCAIGEPEWLTEVLNNRPRIIHMGEDDD
jgi:hypothetical protein